MFLVLLALLLGGASAASPADFLKSVELGPSLAFIVKALVAQDKNDNAGYRQLDDNAMLAVLGNEADPNWPGQAADAALGFTEFFENHDAPESANVDGYETVALRVYSNSGFRAIRRFFDNVRASTTNGDSDLWTAANERAPRLRGGDGGSNSGATMWFLGNDRQFIVKTMKDAEIPLLQNALKAYVAYMRANAGVSLMPRYLAAFKLTVNGVSMTYVVFSSISPSRPVAPLSTQTFDIKASRKPERCWTNEDTGQMGGG